MTTYNQISNSTYLDFAGYQIAPQSNFNQLAALPSTNLTTPQFNQVNTILSSFIDGVASVGATSTVSYTAASAQVVVGLVVKRDADPSSLLAGDWAQRQAALADQAAVWNTYGSTAVQSNGLTNYQAVLNGVTSQVGTSALMSDGVTANASSRTVWLTLTPGQFQSLFNTDLLTYQSTSTLNPNGQSAYAWSGQLSLPSTFQSLVSGIWFTPAPPYGTPTAAYTTPIQVGDGFLSQGNSLVASPSISTPTQVAQAYHFPLTTHGVTTAPVALVEGGLPAGPTGNAITPGSLQSYLEQYRTTVLNLPATATGTGNLQVFVPSTYTPGDSSEESLDISVVAGASPNSQVLYYVSSAGTFATMQNGIFASNHAHVLSSSFTDQQRYSPNSPFASAYQNVVVDAALSNISVFLSSGDGGSGGEYGSGLPMGRPSHASPFAVIVGGTSISTLSQAGQDTTLASLYQGAIQNDPSTLIALTASGLMALPSNMSSSTFSIFVQTVWNTYAYNSGMANTLSPTFLGNNASTGGVDAGSSVPKYQAEFGLAPTSANGIIGRGLPDVSALAGGNGKYESINSAYIAGPAQAPFTIGSAGTSAAAPLWASLTAQFDTIFTDQRLPHLGYYNDLLYIAAAIAPGSFADVTIGNNTSSYYMYSGPAGNPYVITQNDPKSAGEKTSSLIATGLGYSATPGYDETTGLGTPNGLLLARALTAIAHSQIGAPSHPDMVTTLDAVTAQSTISQSLLVQATGTLGHFELDVGHHAYAGVADGSSLAWTNRLAEQVLQSDFDPALVRLLDGANQAIPTTLHVGAGEAVTSSVAGYALGLYQSELTSSYGFASFGGQSTGVTLARPVAVAETVDGAHDQTAVVRVRQNGVDSTSITFYKVDDLSGTIDGIAPGDPRYAAAAAAHAYHLGDGSTALAGPGYGNYTQTTLLHVSQGDLVAMSMTNGGQTYWGFADANETVNGAHVTHLWNYGLNTYGFEDTYGGGDKDYNDLIVQLDFTSLAGHGWIA